MNGTDMKNLTSVTTTQMTEAWTTGSSAALQTETTIVQVVTTAAPPSPDSAVIAVVIVFILLTVAVLGFLLYRYLFRNKGQYRTTGELAPGEDLDEDFNNQATGEKKEYFI